VYLARPIPSWFCAPAVGEFHFDGWADAVPSGEFEMKKNLVIVTTIAGIGLFAAGGITRSASRAVSAAPVAASTPTRTVQFSYVIHVPAVPEGSHELRLWAPMPYQDLYQAISDLKIESPVPYKMHREAEYGDQYAYMTIAAVHAKAPFDIHVSFRATRSERRVALTGASDTVDQPIISVARFLQPDALVPIDGVIAELSQQQTKGVSLPLDKARKIYDYVIATMHYDHDGTDWGRGDALWACNSKHGNCTDFHSLFIGMARAAGIPARFEIGFPLPLDKTEGAITSYHCWAEFYVGGIGWIPIDASEAWKHKEKIDYFFGGLDVNRVMFTLGRDIELTPPQKGGPLNYSVYPYAEMDGTPFTGLKEDYSFRDVATGASHSGN
jgi:transglutaminase-like putative cysteine protease